MNKKLIFPIVLIFSMVVSSVWGGELTGRVFDSETNNLIKDVNIKILETGKVVTTDKRGIYDVKNLPAGRYHLLVSHVGYDVSDTVAVEVFGIKTLDIKLRPSPWVLNDVVITGTRSPHLLKDVPVQTEVVTKRDFKRVGATTVDEALTSTIGVNINEDLSGQGATIRGIQGNRVLVLVDGERAVGRVRGTIDLSQYSLNNVKKIEIVKGTGSTLYGSDAMGGVINIITEKPAMHVSKGNIYFDYGSYRSLNPSLDLEYGNKRTGINLGGKFYSTNGFDLDKSTPHTNGLEKTDRWNFNGKIRHKLSDKWEVTTSGRYMDENKNWIESEIVEKNVLEDTTYVYNDEEINKRYEGSTSLQYLSGDKYSMKMNVYGTYYDHTWNKYSKSFWIDTSKTKDEFFEASYDANYVIGPKHVATYGINYNYQNLKSTELIDESKADKSEAGYLQYEYSPLKQLNFVMGMRYEHHSSFGGHFNPSFNVMYQPSEQFKLRGFVGKGFRAPSIKEQYFIFDHTAAGYIVYGGSAIQYANINFSGLDFKKLKQEKSVNGSVSMEFSYGTIGLHRLTLFYNHLDDLIDFTLIGFPDPYWRGVYVYQNIESAVTKGIEWESRIRFSHAMDLSVSYDYLYSCNLETHERLINRPDHTLKFFLTGYLDRWGVGGTFWGDYQSDKLWVPRSNTGGNEGAPEYAPHRTRFNLNLFKRFENGLETFVRLENLLNETNITYGYWPGFEVYAGIKYGFTYKK
ncbi:MAG: TonB-dependent receptor [FCB group bacterium]|nr:TonB-dependent receptor [FCB group bacterium]